LMLADNKLSSGFQALADANLQKLVHLDLSGNNISDVSVLEPLVALGELRHLLLAENEVANKESYRDDVFEILPQLITVDGFDRDGTEIEVDADEVLSGDDDEGAHYAEGNAESEEDEGEDQIEDTEAYNDEDEEEEEEEESRAASNRHHVQGDESEDIGSEDENDEEDEEDEEVESGTDSELEDQENRPPTIGGKTSGESRHADDDDEEDDDDELDDDEDDEGDVHHQQHQNNEIVSGSDDDEDDEDEEEEDEDEGDEEEGPGLAYLLNDDIPDDNDREFVPTNEGEEDSEIESSDEDEYGGLGNNVDQSSNTKTNGNHTKRPRSPALASPGDFDHGQAGFDVDGDDSTNGFGMSSFDGPATFDDDASHESKRPRT
ncbi:Acidic leucine-rich nuclear phosphoprotein 32 member, partial [Entomortierella chlamydospora]